MISSRKKKNFRLSLFIWGAGLLVIAACLWLGLHTEATVISVLLLLNAIPALAGWLQTWLKNRKPHTPPPSQP